MLRFGSVSIAGKREKYYTTIGNLESKRSRLKAELEGTQS